MTEFERQQASIKAKKAALEKFRAKAADPALANRLTARAEHATVRRAALAKREIEKADKKARDWPAPGLVDSILS